MSRPGSAAEPMDVDAEATAERTLHTCEKCGEVRAPISQLYIEGVAATPFGPKDPARDWQMSMGLLCINCYLEKHLPGYPTEQERDQAEEDIRAGWKGLCTVAFCCVLCLNEGEVRGFSWGLIPGRPVLFTSSM